MSSETLPFRHDHVATVLFRDISQLGVVRIIEREIDLLDLRQIEQVNLILGELCCPVLQRQRNRSYPLQDGMK